MAPKRWHVTSHALDAYLDRFAPDADPNEARERLAACAEGASLIGPAVSGKDLFAHPDWPHAQFVVAKPMGRQTQSALVTVVPAPCASDGRILLFPTRNAVR